MLTLHTRTHSPYTPQQLMELVADVRRYPEFLPWCKLARVTSRNEHSFLAELVISFKGLTERYTSLVTLHPQGPVPAIDVRMVSGPFEHLSNRWEFHPLPGEDSGTEIDFHLDFRFKSKVLEKMLGGVFLRAQEKMADAFRDRADELYGGGGSDKR